MSKALVVLSGGQDSTTCLLWALERFKSVEAISFDYGQKHRRELEAAARLSFIASVRHEIISVPSGILESTSPLTDPKAMLETYSSPEEMEKIIGNRVEKTFVPMRNALFLTIAGNRAVVRDAFHIVTGVCQDDNANYPDCRAAFIEHQQMAINEALGYEDPTKHFGTTGYMRLDEAERASVANYERQGDEGGIFIHAPLMFTPKADAIIHSMINFFGWFYMMAYTHTAYSGEYPPKTQDHATVLRAQAFEKAGVPDPLLVRAAYERRIPMPLGPAYQKYDRWIEEIMPKTDVGPNEVQVALATLGSTLKTLVARENTL